MDVRFTALLAVFARAREREPADLISFVRGLPEPGALPSPWETWTLIGLSRHRERQLWVADIIRTRLRGSPSDLAAGGAFGHPEAVPQSGPVPGMSEWEYYFHGKGCCLTHKVEGVEIDVDFWDDSAEYFDIFFYTKYLESLRRPEPPEQRLRDLHRSTRPVRIVVEDLIAAGALIPLPGRDAQVAYLGELTRRRVLSPTGFRAMTLAALLLLALAILRAPPGRGRQPPRPGVAT